MKWLDLINKRLREKRAYINNVDEAIYRVFAKEIKPLPPESQLSDFYHPSENQKSGELFLLQWVQVETWQHMPYAGNLNKLQRKKNYTEHAINLITFGLVARQ